MNAEILFGTTDLYKILNIDSAASINESMFFPTIYSIIFTNAFDMFQLRETITS